MNPNNNDIDWWIVDIICMSTKRKQKSKYHPHEDSNYCVINSEICVQKPLWYSSEYATSVCVWYIVLFGACARFLWTSLHIGEQADPINSIAEQFLGYLPLFTVHSHGNHSIFQFFSWSTPIYRNFEAYKKCSECRPLRNLMMATPSFPEVKLAMVLLSRRFIIHFPPLGCSQAKSEVVLPYDSLGSFQVKGHKLRVW